MTDDELDEAYKKCWCEQDLDRDPHDIEAEYPEDYKEDHMIYQPYEGFSPFAAFMSVMLCAVIITLLIGLFG